MLWFDWIVFNIKLWYHATFAIDRFELAACPSCGLVGAKKIRFMNAYQKPILTCPRCSAQWGMNPVAPYNAWGIKGMEEVELEAQAKADEQAAERQNELFKR